MTNQKFDETHLQMIRAACQHTKGKVSSAVALQLFNELDELRAALKDCRNATLWEVNREVSGSSLLSNTAALEVRAILRKMKS